MDRKTQYRPGAIAGSPGITPAELRLVYLLSAGAFLLSTVLDSGSPDYKFFGFSPAMLTMAALAPMALLLWRGLDDAIIGTCATLIAAWLLFQLAIGQSIRSAFLILSVLVFALAVGAIRSRARLLRWQILLTGAGPLIAALPFYLGMWRPNRTGQLTVLGFNPNHLAVFLASGVVALTGAGLLCQGARRFALFAAAFLLIPPLWFSGSRSGMGIALLSTAVLIIARSPHPRKAALVTGVGIAAFLLLLFPLLLGVLGDTAVTTRFREQFAIGQMLRLRLMWSGLVAFSRKPWLGHGMDAPRSFDWLNNNMFYAYAGYEAGAVTHAGYVDYLIMGGIPIALVFVTLHFRIVWRLVHSLKKATAVERDYLAIALGLMVVFLCDVFFGELFTKRGWFFAGLALQTVAVVKAGSMRPPGVPPRPVAAAMPGGDA